MFNRLLEQDVSRWQVFPELFISSVSLIDVAVSPQHVYRRYILDGSVLSETRIQRFCLRSWSSSISKRPFAASSEYGVDGLRLCPKVKHGDGATDTGLDPMPSRCWVRGDMPPDSLLL